MVYYFYALLEFGVCFAVIRNLSKFNGATVSALLLMVLLYNVVIQQVIQTEALGPVLFEIGRVPATPGQAFFVVYFYNFLRNIYATGTNKNV